MYRQAHCTPGAARGPAERSAMSVRRFVAGAVGVLGLALLLGSGLRAQIVRTPPPEPSAAEVVSPAPTGAQAAPSARHRIRVQDWVCSFRLRPRRAYRRRRTTPSSSASAQVQPGVIDLIRRDDELFLDLRPENFDKPYIIMPSIAKGIGGEEAFAGRVYDPLVVIFKRVGGTRPLDQPQHSLCRRQG